MTALMFWAFFWVAVKRRGDACEWCPFSAQSNWESCERSRQHNNVISETSWRAACYLQTKKTNQISGSSDNIHRLDLIHSCALDTFCSKGSTTDCSGIGTELAFGPCDRRQSGRSVCWNTAIPLKHHFNVLATTYWFYINPPPKKQTNESYSAAYWFLVIWTFYQLQLIIPYSPALLCNRCWKRTMFLTVFMCWVVRLKHLPT